MSMLLSGLRYQQQQLLVLLNAKGTGLYVAPSDAEFESASTDYNLVFI